jgi:hypothetical protein
MSLHVIRGWNTGVGRGVAKNQIRLSWSQAGKEGSQTSCGAADAAHPTCMGY